MLLHQPCLASAVFASVRAWEPAMRSLSCPPPRFYYRRVAGCTKTYLSSFIELPRFTHIIVLFATTDLDIRDHYADTIADVTILSFFTLLLLFFFFSLRLPACRHAR